MEDENYIPLSPKFRANDLKADHRDKPIAFDKLLDYETESRGDMVDLTLNDDYTIEIIDLTMDSDEEDRNIQSSLVVRKGASYSDVTVIEISDDESVIEISDDDDTLDNSLRARCRRARQQRGVTSRFDIPGLDAFARDGAINLIFTSQLRPSNSVPPRPNLHDFDHIPWISKPRCSECCQRLDGTSPLRVPHRVSAAVMKGYVCEGCLNLYEEVTSLEGKVDLTLYLFYGVFPGNRLPPPLPSDDEINRILCKRVVMQRTRKNFSAPAEHQPDPLSLFLNFVNHDRKCAFSEHPVHFERMEYGDIRFARASIDHIFPLSRTAHPRKWRSSNLVITCHALNMAKKNVLPFEFSYWWMQFREIRWKQGIMPLKYNPKINYGKLLDSNNPRRYGDAFTESF